MKLKASIELFEKHEKVTVYSLRFEGEEYTEFEKFLLAFSESKSKDIDIIIARLDKIFNNGVFERHFRYAGKCKDRTAELPSHFDTTNLRVYCICVSPSILILGNGGIKTTRTYQEDTLLNRYMENLQRVDEILRGRQKDGTVLINDGTLSGDLSLTI